MINILGLATHATSMFGTVFNLKLFPTDGNLTTYKNRFTASVADIIKICSNSKLPGGSGKTLLI